MSAVKAVYQNICWAICALGRNRAGFTEGHALRLPAGVYFCSHSIALVTA